MRALRPEPGSLWACPSVPDPKFPHSPTISVSSVTDGQTYGDSQDLIIGWTPDDADSRVKSFTGTLDGEPFESGTAKPLYEPALGEHTLHRHRRADGDVLRRHLHRRHRRADLPLQDAGKLTAKSADRLRVNLATVRDAQEKDKKNDKIMKELEKFQNLVKYDSVVTDAQIRDTLPRDADALIAEYADTPED